jgi:lipopolysaccharide export system protein LptA
MSHLNLPVSSAAAALAFVLLAQGAVALESDRQQPLEVSADDTGGTLGDGTTVLSGNVEIRQGTLHVLASEAQVEKTDGKVHTITLLGQPARLSQEIEEQGLVEAEANRITYQVSAGVVRLTGAVDVVHPQYRITGETLVYSLDDQHFEGAGSGDPDQDGRVTIRLEPEVASEIGVTAAPPESPEADASDTDPREDGDDGEPDPR